MFVAVKCPSVSVENAAVTHSDGPPTAQGGDGDGRVQHWIPTQRVGQQIRLSP